MITGINAMFHTSAPAEAREVLREVLAFNRTEVGEDWLVFDVPQSELAVHPLDGERDPYHTVSFACDDIEAIDEAGVEVLEPVEDWGFGPATVIELPGGVRVELYEPSMVWVESSGTSTRRAHDRSLPEQEQAQAIE